MSVAIGVPAAVSTVVVLIAALIQIFFGAIAAVFAITYGVAAVVCALVLLSPRMPWMVRLADGSHGRRLSAVIYAWLAAWALSFIGFSAISVTIVAPPTVTYVLQVAASSLVGTAPFLVIYITAAVLSRRYLFRG